VLMAILIGAFMIQGLVPGPDMLIPEAKGGHQSLTFCGVWIMVVSNIITVAACLVFLNQLVRITYIRGSVIIPVILLLVYLGTFAEKNAFPDIILMLFFGVLGWIMERLDWPRPPFILGLVLGNLAETRLFLAVQSYGASWLLRPAVMVIMAITLFGALYPVLRQKRIRKSKKEPASPSPDTTSSGKPLGLRFSWGAVFSLALVVIFASALWQSRKFSFTAGFFPWVIGIPVLTFAAIQFVLELIGRSARIDPREKVEVDIGLPQEVVNKRTAGVFAWTFGWFAGIWLFGFTVGAPLCTFIQLKIGEREKWPLALALTFTVWAFVYVIFVRLLHVPFPKGEIFLWIKQLSSM
jgi:hypothetical protein